MLRRLAAGSLVFALVLLLVAPPASPFALAAGGTCTGWSNEYVPPPTIRVYRTFGPARGTVQVVPFQQYVTTVVAAEFGPTAPTEALRAGAVAVKDYGWFYTMVWRGRAAPHGAGCYDVQDNSWDQVYWPERYHANDRQRQAVLDTWPVSVRKNGGFLLTGYRPGVPGTACGVDADGWRLYQASAYRCALQGMRYPEILRTYYGPHFEIVRPGLPNPNGDGLGAIGIAVPGTGPAPGGALPTPAPALLPSASPVPGASESPAASAAPGAWGTPGASPGPSATPSPTPGPSIVPTFYDLVWTDAPQQPWQPATLPSGSSLDPVTTLGWAFGDLNGDGRADLVRLLRMGTAGYRITVSLSQGNGVFSPAATWWSNVGTRFDLAPDAVVRLLVGDFDGDGVDDAAILAGIPGRPPIASGPNGTPAIPAVVPEAKLFVLRSTGSSFAPPQTWWTGPLDVSRAQVFAADATGDGRADFVVEADLYPTDLPAAEATPPATTPPGTTPPTLAPDGTELPIGIRLSVAPALSDGSFGPLEGWIDLTDTTQAAARTVVEDVNRDGRSDVVLLRPFGAAGSQLVGLLSTGTSFARTTLWTSTAFRTSASKIAAADLNGDGRGDLVVLYNAGAAGTRLYQFISTGTAFRATIRVLDPTLRWDTVEPF